jgi:hypothetical protein
MSLPPAVLFAVIDTGIWSVEQVRAWADRLIDEGAASTSWLFDLSVASTLGDAASAMRHRFVERGFVLPDDFAEVLVGLLYLRFQRGDLTRQQLEASVADVLDAYETPGFDVEGWTEQMKSGADIPASTKARLEHMARASAEALERLRDVSLVKRDPFFVGD